MRSLTDVKKLIDGKKRKVEDSEELAIRAHHILMKEYGWIPYEEFLRTPLPVTINLLKEIEKDKNAEKKEIEKMKRKSKGRRR